MSAPALLSISPSNPSWRRHHPYVQTPLPPPDTGHFVFTRQLWKRTMPDDSQADSGVSNKSHSQTVHSIASGTSRRSSSTISLRPRNRSPSPSSRSNVPLTPEESPPFKSTRKRSAGAVEQKDKAIASAEASPAHARSNSGDTVPHVCLCQPDPKIPRPRNGKISAKHR